jgi:hypothetical protein
VRRARRLHAEVLVGAAAAMPVRVGVETSMLRLDAVARADDLPLFPSRASTFGGLVVPLAHHPLRWIAAAPGSLTLSLSPMRRATLRAPPESRPCEDLRLRPVPPFEPVELPPPAARRRLLLGPGVWNLYPAPDSRDGPSAAFDLVRGDTVWLLEEGPARWARVLWTTDLAAIFGWVDRRTHVRPALGHGYGTGTGSHHPSTCLRPTTCTADVPLLAIDRGEPRLVGRVLRGAAVRVGVSDGGRTPVYVCDPDVEWADGVVVFIPSDRAGACDAPPPVAPRTSPAAVPPHRSLQGTIPEHCAAQLNTAAVQETPFTHA